MKIKNLTYTVSRKVNAKTSVSGYFRIWLAFFFKKAFAWIYEFAAPPEADRKDSGIKSISA